MEAKVKCLGDFALQFTVSFPRKKLKMTMAYELRLLGALMMTTLGAEAFPVPVSRSLSDSL